MHKQVASIILTLALLVPAAMVSAQISVDPDDVTPTDNCWDTIHWTIDPNATWVETDALYAFNHVAFIGKGTDCTDDELPSDYSDLDEAIETFSDDESCILTVQGTLCYNYWGPQATAYRAAPMEIVDTFLNGGTTDEYLCFIQADETPEDASDDEWECIDEYTFGPKYDDPVDFNMVIEIEDLPEIANTYDDRDGVTSDELTALTFGIYRDTNEPLNGGTIKVTSGTERSGSSDSTSSHATIFTADTLENKGSEYEFTYLGSPDSYREFTVLVGRDSPGAFNFTIEVDESTAMPMNQGNSTAQGTSDEVIFTAMWADITTREDDRNSAHDSWPSRGSEYVQHLIPHPKTGLHGNSQHIRDGNWTAFQSFWENHGENPEIRTGALRMAILPDGNGGYLFDQFIAGSYSINDNQTGLPIIGPVASSLSTTTVTMTSPVNPGLMATGVLSTSQYIDGHGNVIDSVLHSETEYEFYFERLQYSLDYYTTVIDNTTYMSQSETGVGGYVRATTTATYAGDDTGAPRLLFSLVSNSSAFSGLTGQSGEIAQTTTTARLDDAGIQTLSVDFRKDLSHYLTVVDDVQANVGYTPTFMAYELTDEPYYVDGAGFALGGPFYMGDGVPVYTEALIDIGNGRQNIGDFYEHRTYNWTIAYTGNTGDHAPRDDPYNPGTSKVLTGSTVKSFDDGVVGVWIGQTTAYVKGTIFDRNGWSCDGDGDGVVDEGSYPYARNDCDSIIMHETESPRQDDTIYVLFE